MSRADVKVQINSKAALERLLGGDSELEIELRKSVATAFSRQFLHDIVASPAMQKVVSEVHQFIQQKISEELGTFKVGWNGKIESLTLSSELKEAIKREAKKRMDVEVEAWLRVASNEQMEKMKQVAETQRKIIMRELEAEIKKQVKEEVSALVAQLVKGVQ